MNDNRTTVDQQVRDYNDDTNDAVFTALTGLKRPRISLADMAQLAAGNDNEEEGVVNHG